MTDLLIHSMAEFAPIITGALHISETVNIVEIGAEFGGTTALLAERALAKGGQLTSIDPAPKQAFIDWIAANPHVRHLAAPSLEVVEQCESIDAWFIDGDHNWYTVFHELKAIDAVCQRDGKPLLAFLHDVAWPCARRDSYYAPSSIPQAFRQPFDYDGGVVPDVAGLLPGRGFRGMGQFAWAVREGGPRNGVLTGVEDFMADAGREMAFAQIPGVFGLGILFDHHASWSEALGRFLLPWHRNSLLATLERNRLANYLRVLDLQDSPAIAAAA